MKLIDAIPSMKLIDTVEVWRKCLERLDRARDDRAAREVLVAIQRQWRRRDLGDDLTGFDWPTTEAPGGNGSLHSLGWQREGVLSLMGYHVGKNGERPGLRRRILSEVFSGPIPRAFSAHHLAEWGQPGSVLRLRKLAGSIAAFARNAKRRHASDMQSAIDDWEADLEFLYRECYCGLFNFDWPNSSI